MSDKAGLEDRIDFLAAQLRASEDNIASAVLALELDELMEQAETNPGFWIAEVAQAPKVDRGCLELAIERLRALEERDFCAGILALLLLLLERQQADPGQASEDAAGALLKALIDYRLEKFYIARAFDADLVTALVLRLACAWPGLDLMPLLHQLNPHEFFQCLREKDWVRPFFPGAATVLVHLPELFRFSWGSFDNLNGLVDCAANLGVLDQIVGVVESWQEPAARARAEARIAAILARASSSEEVMAWTSVASPSTTQLLVEEVKLQRNSGHLQRARFLTGQIPDGKVRVGFFADIAWDFLRRNEVRDALECLRSVVSSVEEASDLELILAEAPRLDEPGKNPGDLASDFETLIHELWARAAKKSGKLRRVLQCSLIEIMAYLGNERKAWQMSDLVEASCEKVVVTSALIAWGRERGDTDARLERALAEARALQYRWESCSALLHVVIAASRVAPEKVRGIFFEVFALAREIAEVRVSRLLLSVQQDIVKCLAAVAPFDGSESCFFEMLELIAETKGLVNPESVLSVAVSFRERIDSENQRSRWVRRFMEVGAAGGVEDALKSLAHQSAKLGLLDEVKICLDKIEESERIALLVSLAEQLWHQDRTNALIFLEEAEVIARKPAKNSYAFPQYKVITGLAGLGLLGRAVELASSVRSVAERCQAFANLAFLSLSDLGTAQHLLVTFLKTAKSQKFRTRWPFDTAALAALACELANVDPQGLRRVELFDWALARIQPRVPDAAQRIIWLTAWFRLVIENIPVHQSRQLLEKAQYRILEATDQQVRDDGISQVAGILLQAGELGWAGRLAETLTSRYQYASLLCDLALLEARNGKERDATEHLSSALDALANEKLYNSGSPPQVLALPAIRVMQNRELRDQTMAFALAPLLRIELDTERAQALLKLGEALAAGESDSWVVQVLVNLCIHIERAEMPRYALELEELRIGLLAGLGEFDEALAATKRIDPSSWNREGALLRIVRELIRQGYTGALFSVFSKFRTTQFRVKALKEIALGSGEKDSEKILPSLLRETALIDDTIQQLETLELLASDAKWNLASTEIQGMLERVEDSLYSLLEHSEPGRGLRSMVRLWTLLGQEQRALDLLRRAGGGRLSVPALQSFIEMTPAMGMISWSGSDKEAWFLQVAALIEDVDSTPLEIHLQIQLARLQVRANCIEMAGRTLEKMLLLAEQAPTLQVDWIEEAAGVLEAPFGNKWELADRLFRLAELLESREKRRAIAALAKVGLIPENLVRGRLAKLRENLRLEYVQTLRKALFESAANPVHDIRRTLSLAAATAGAGTSGMIWLGAALLKAGALSDYQKLVDGWPGRGLPSIEAQR